MSAGNITIFHAGPVRSCRPRLTVSAYGYVRTILAIILTLAGVLKGYQLATTPTLDHGLLSSRWFFLAVIEFELFASCWLLSNLAPTVTRRVAIVGFSVFASVSLYKALTGAESCGCFGRISVNPWLTLGFDLLAVTALILARPQMRPSQVVQNNTLHRHKMTVDRSFERLALVIFAWSLIGGPLGLSAASFRPATLSSGGSLLGNDRFVVLEPEKWVGKAFPLVRHIDIGAELARGDWTLLFYHHDCPKCQEALHEYGIRAAKLRAARATARVALIEVPPFGELPIEESTHCRHGRLDGLHEWFVSAPAEVLISDGVVLPLQSPETQANRAFVAMNEPVERP